MVLYMKYILRFFNLIIEPYSTLLFLRLDNLNCVIFRNVISFDLTRIVTFEDYTYKFLFVIL